MVGGWQGAVLRALGAREHAVKVTGRELLSPGFLRLHFASKTLFDQAEALPGSWIRLWFPENTDRGGRRRQKAREHQRGYTLVDPDPVSGTFAVDFLLHEPAGPASAWATNASVGDELTAQYMGSHAFTPAPDAAGVLIVADPCSIPAANEILAATAPAAVPTELLIEYSHETDRQIPVHGSARWFHRGAKSGMIDAITEGDWSGWQVWLMGERTTVQTARKLLSAASLPKEHAHAQAYWVMGRPMGKVRDNEESQR